MGMKSEYRKLYQERLPIGQAFQDHCTYWIQRELNIIIGNFQSKEYQFKFGENAQGFEIKYDMNFKKTNNFWIEVEHRVHPEQSYYLGGILRPDNAWLYCIGNYEVLYVFSKKLLCLLHNTGKYKVIENHLRTSRGYLLPLEDADKYCAHKIITNDILKQDNEVFDE